jgi:hypothetical protein
MFSVVGGDFGKSGCIEKIALRIPDAVCAPYCDVSE